MKAIDRLEKYSPCKESVIWLDDKGLQEAWETCERGDWMLWAYQKLYPDNVREITLAKGHIANTVRHLMKDERSIKAVDSAIDFGNGLIGIDDLNNAAHAAADAAAAYAAIAHAAAAYAAAYDFYAAVSAVSAAYAAAAAADAAYAVRKASLLESANICRQYLTIGE